MSTNRFATSSAPEPGRGVLQRWLSSLGLLILGVGVGYGISVLVREGRAEVAKADVSRVEAKGRAKVKAGAGTAAEDEVTPKEGEGKAAVRSPFFHPEVIAKSPQVWLPREVVKLYSWSLGDYGEHFDVTDQAKKVLRLSKEEAVGLKETLDRHLQALRGLERSKVQILSQTDEKVELRLPGDVGGEFAPAREALRGEVREMLGEARGELFLHALNEELALRSPVYSGQEWRIDVQLKEGEMMEVSIQKPAGSSGYQGNAIPAGLRHLVGVLEDGSL
ncbi:hypothetical protein [Verrucomicrobium sp. BvORR106]|uniref:hypothetical protein n=1 Tax=Verrucomicrobium sp. BvORR106 TaxID=1403819 RepID=UPI002241041F|nr:hypothetical protein [Verrucomicrobium sp. BvORR106]